MFHHVLPQGFGFKLPFTSRPWLWREAFPLLRLAAEPLDGFRAGLVVFGGIRV
jgi:hypothetical protein